MFAACGNTIRVYSLKTGLQVETLRNSRSSAAAVEGRVGKSGPDVHKSDIVALSLIRQSQDSSVPSNGDYFTGDYKLFSLCARGILAEWDAPTRELLSISNLQIGEGQGKIRLAHLDDKNLVTY